MEQLTVREKIRETLGRLGIRDEPLVVSKARGPSQPGFFDSPTLCDGVDPPAPDQAT